MLFEICCMKHTVHSALISSKTINRLADKKNRWFLLIKNKPDERPISFYMKQ